LDGGVLILLIFSTATVLARPPAADDFVDVARALPSVTLELRYATPDNFTHAPIYPVARCLLRRSVVERLARVVDDLSRRHVSLKLWDCYLPLAVQRELWRRVPDPRYVADPAKGSRHNRGAAVDVTLVDAHGRELAMGTPFDDFGPRAHRDATGLDDAARHNRALLDGAMERAGFLPFATEWWHFDAPDWAAFPVADVPLQAIAPH
jgi:zinc D-Ala-D-Ala dipeptidase